MTPDTFTALARTYLWGMGYALAALALLVWVLGVVSQVIAAKRSQEFCARGRDV